MSMIWTCRLTKWAILIMGMLITNEVAMAAQGEFGPSNPFYTERSLHFQAPPFDIIKDSDYQPAIEVLMARQIEEVLVIAENPAPPTFEYTVVALEKTGQLFVR